MSRLALKAVETSSSLRGFLGGQVHREAKRGVQRSQFVLFICPVPPSAFGVLLDTASVTSLISPYTRNVGV